MIDCMRPVRPRIAALVAVVVTLTLPPFVPPSSAASRPGGSPPAALPTGRAEVTLITGDRVTLVRDASGKPQVLLDPEQDDFVVRRDGTRIEVIPRSVLRLVPDVLDPRLFDVTGLVEMGYDDAHTGTLPLIAHRAPGVPTLTADPALNKLTELTSIGGVAMELSKARAKNFSADLARLGRLPKPASAAAATLGGIDRIWLDAKVSTAGTWRATPAATTPPTTTLDPYLTQISAPAAWNAGLTGTGVRVAVLDSGIDTGHPALTKKVVAERNFTESPDAGDVAGHGTHVASLLAGTGAGSGGALRGIAPAADLLNGKVLGDEGDGRASWVIAGMEWAVEQDADIVNLSLGGRAGDSDDPVVQALDKLSTGSGTLFVVAAGNDGWVGWDPYTIDSPGTAASALTVGAVTADDRLARISGEGPARGSYRTKPDLTAPGEEIPGARAGARDGDLYVPMSGTSMATPIVAGAAALTMQQHPDWTWEQVKSAVAVSADRLSSGPWSIGAGRVALNNLIKNTVLPIPSTLSPGPFLHPNNSPWTRTVTLTNTGTEPRTFTATDAESSPVDSATATDAALVVSPATVTVPPGGTAQVKVTFDPRLVADTYWHGHIDLTGDDGATLRLPFGTYDEPEQYWLDLTVLDRNGDPYAGGEVPLQNGDNGHFYRAVLDERGWARVRVVPGHYSAFARIDTPATQTTPATFTLAGSAEVAVTKDTTLTIDARQARPLLPPTVPGRPTRPTELSLAWGVAGGDRGYIEVAALDPADATAGRVFVTPTGPRTHGRLEVATRWRLEPAGPPAPGRPDAYELDFVRDRLTLSPALSGRDVARLAEVTTAFHAPAPGATVYAGLVSESTDTIGLVHRREIAAPFTETTLTTADPALRWGREDSWTAPGMAYLASPELRSYDPGTRVTATPARGLHPDVRRGSTHHTRGYLSLEQGLSDGALSGPIPPESVTHASTKLYRNGTLVTSTPGLFLMAEVPDEPSRYRLVGDVRFPAGDYPADGHSEWEFTSAAPTDPDIGQTVPPLLTADYGPSVDLHGQAPRNRNLTFDLRIGHPTGANAPNHVQSAQLSWSPDGATWHKLDVRRTGATTFTARIAARDLRNATAVSVHLHAADPAGNRLDHKLLNFIPLH
jgi:subtilisin family serine protease